jgi:hypothetical protein
MSTVWRTVATGDGGRFLCSHPLPSGGSGEENVHRLATGGFDRGGSGEEDVHRLANGGYGRTVATFASYPWGVQRLIVGGLVRFDDFKLMGLHR